MGSGQVLSPDRRLRAYSVRGAVQAKCLGWVAFHRHPTGTGHEGLKPNIGLG